ncbi:hypothetical protein DFH09DRAFT_1340664 [Mycena vulgaris]|nr:hypothetical protein DFH09DRAFT_1340664 [Mycena vulgaris]
MHTSETTGIDTDLAKDLDNPITWIPPLEGSDEDSNEDIVDKAAKDLQKLLEDEEPVPVEPGSVISGDLVDFTELERIERGEVAGIEEDNIDIVGGDSAGAWNIQDLM